MKHTHIVFVISATWPPKAVLWIRQLGGKLNNSSDRDGPYGFCEACPLSLQLA